MSRNPDNAIIMAWPAIIKARPEASGRRIVEVEASTEEVDADGDIILQQALLQSAETFVATGHLDLDHKSELGHRMGIADPASYIVGRPLDVRKGPNGRTFVEGEISRSLNGKSDPVRNRYDEFWESLQRDPPVQWFSSIYGWPLDLDDCTEGECSNSEATRWIIKKIDWRSLAFTRTPKNTALTSAARIITAKAYIELMKGDGSRDSPLILRDPADLASLTHRISASPTEAQAAAGNYPKGHAVVGGLGVTVETPMGGVRRGMGKDGKPWSVRMPADYGYAKRTEGADGDHVDVYLGPNAHRAERNPVWVVDQISDEGGFDEHKALVGFPTRDDACRTYCAGFSDGRGPDRMGAVTELSFQAFRDWLDHGDTKNPLTYQDKSMKATTTQRAPEPQMPQSIPPSAQIPHDMAALWASRECPGCGVHTQPSLLGYRSHFEKCQGLPKGAADVCSHALMHKHSMDRLFDMGDIVPPAMPSAVDRVA